VVDRGEPEAPCSEWHGDGTAGEDHRASHLAAVAPARAMGEARPGRHEPRWQAPVGARQLISAIGRRPTLGRTALGEGRDFLSPDGRRSMALRAVGAYYCRAGRSFSSKM
jgi:hypothetical protein